LADAGCRARRKGELDLLPGTDFTYEEGDEAGNPLPSRSSCVSCLTLRWEGGPGSRRLLLHQTHTHLLRHAKIALNSTDNVTFRRRKNTIVASFAPAVLPTLPRSSSLRKTSFCLLHRFRLASLSPNYVMRRAGSADSGGTTRTRYKISRI
jgi:hypothetical protein